MNKNKFLLDTNTASSLTQKYAAHHTTVAAKINSLNDDDEIYVSIVTLYEMEYGARHATNIELADAMYDAIVVSNDHKMFVTIQKINSDFRWEDWTQ